MRCEQVEIINDIQQTIDMNKNVPPTVTAQQPAQQNAAQQPSSHKIYHAQPEMPSPNTNTTVESIHLER